LDLIDRARASFSGKLFLCCQQFEQEKRSGEHTTLSRVYKMLDAMELSGTNGETDSRGICGLISKKF
jgi:hypothetical protein